jgi:hypothetical protein
MLSGRKPIPGADPGFEIETGLVKPNRLHHLLWLDGVVVDGNSSLIKLYKAAVLGGRAKYQ